MKLKWRNAAPSEVCILLPAISCVSLGSFSFSNNTAYELSLMVYYSSIILGSDSYIFAMIIKRKLYYDE